MRSAVKLKLNVIFECFAGSEGGKTCMSENCNFFRKLVPNLAGYWPCFNWHSGNEVLFCGVQVVGGWFCVVPQLDHPACRQRRIQNRIKSWLRGLTRQSNLLCNSNKSQVFWMYCKMQPNRKNTKAGTVNSTKTKRACWIMEIPFNRKYKINSIMQHNNDSYNNNI